MPATDHLPAEIWQIILRYGIGVADFLNPDAFKGLSSDLEYSDRNNEAAYWQAETNRRTFQCVCKSWNGYLRPFEYRFVRMLDIWHKTIPTSTLQSAVRISFGRYNCRCDALCLPQIDKWWSPARPGSILETLWFRQFYRALLEEVAPLEKLLILDAKNERIPEGTLYDLFYHAVQIKPDFVWEGK